MSVRLRVLKCKKDGCNIGVARGQVTDELYIWELQLHPSVTNAPALYNGMKVGDFYEAVVTHRVKGDEVRHSIVKPRL